LGRRKRSFKRERRSKKSNKPRIIKNIEKERKEGISPPVVFPRPRHVPRFEIAREKDRWKRERRFWKGFLLREDTTEEGVSGGSARSISRKSW